MNSNRKTAVLVGALFLIVTAAFFASDAIITPILGASSYLTAVARHSQLVIAGALIALIDGIAAVGIAAAIYPILKGRHPSLALGYAGMRFAELNVVVVYVLSSLLLVTLSATAANEPGTATLGTLLVSLRHWTLMLTYVITSIGGVMFAYMLTRTRLVPRWLSVLGLIGYPALVVAAVLDMLGLIDAVAGPGLIGLVPGGLFELLLPIWLFVKGFNHTPSIRRAPGALAA